MEENTYNDLSAASDLSPLERLRQIRASQDPPMRKIISIIEMADDYTPEGAHQLITDLFAMLNVKTAPWAANRLIVESEWYFMHDMLFLLDDVNRILGDVHWDGICFQHPCYRAVTPYEDFDNKDPYAHLSEELINKEFHRVSLLVSGLPELLADFNFLEEDYNRPYTVLAELEKKVLGYVEQKKYPLNISIPNGTPLGYDPEFSFSHFEVDTADPDPSFHTLYIVYIYKEWEDV